MKNWKRYLSMVLVLVLCFSLVPAEALASDDSAGGEVSTDDVTFEGTTSVGTLITRTIENAGEEDSSGAGTVLSVTVSEQSATVGFSTDRDSEVIVAIYEDAGIKMLGSGHAFVAAEAESAVIPIEIETMPEYFWTAVYLLDAGSHEPLCEQFISRYYTRDFQALLNSTVDNYDPDRVLNLDERPDTNFAVYSEDVLVTGAAEETGAANRLVDNGDGSYVIYQADESFLKLKAGDVFARENSDGTVLIVVVRTVTVDGTTVTVYEDPDAELDDVFDYVKIDGDSNGAEVYYDNSESDPGVTPGSALETQSLLKDVSEDGSFSNSTSYSIDSETNPKITGSVAYGFTASYQVYLTPEWQYVSFSIKNSASISVSVSAKLFEKEILLGRVYVVTGTGINIDWRLNFVISAEAELKWTGTLSFTVGAVYDSDSDKRISSLCTEPKPSSEFELSGTVSVGLKLEPKFIAISEKLIQASISGSALLVFEVTPRLKDDDDVQHTCIFCTPGTLKAKESVKVGFSLLNGVVKKSKTVASFTQKINDFYICFDRHEVGWGTCPYLSYKISMTFLPKDSEYPLSNTVVTVRIDPTGETLSHDPYAATIEESVETDENGTAPVYVPNGSYTVTASAGKNSCVNHPLTVKGFKKSITLTMDYGTLVTVVDADGNPVPEAGITADGIQESFLTDEDGKALLPVGTGGYSVVITKGSYRLDYMLDGSKAEVTIRLERSFAGPSTCITVVDRNGPVSRASIVVDGTGKTYATNSAGCAYVPLSVGNHVITVSKSGVSETHTIRVDSEDADITLTLNSVFPSSIVKGSCGDNAFWSLDTETQVLTISGEGDMYGYDASGYDGKPAPWFDYRKQIQTIVVANNITSIGDGAFESCTRAVSASVASSVKTIGRDAFSHCDNLTSVTAHGVTSIGDHAFYNCESLVSVSLPSGLKSIGNSAFYYCRALESINLPNTLISIGERAFCCSGLTGIRFPSGLTSIGKEAFMSCTGLTGVLRIPSGVTEIQDGTFNECPGLTGIELPSALTTIGGSAFSGCSGLTSVLIPNGVSSIGVSAFSECTSLASIDIPASVTSIDRWAFEDCSSLTSIDIPSGVRSIGEETFQNCRALKTVSNMAGVTSIGYRAFYGCVSLESIRLPDGLTSIDYSAFYYCTSLTGIDLPSTLTTIGDSAFYCCSSLDHADLPAGLTEISYGVFYGCSGLTRVSIPASVTSIGNNAFYNCSGLDHIDLPAGLTEVPYGAFYGCSGLTRAGIPASVTSIGDYAFFECGNLTGIELPAGLQSIGVNAFEDCGSITSVHLPDTLTSIGRGAFQSSGLTEVTIPEGVTTIQRDTFYWCLDLQNAVLPHGLTTIEQNAFYNSGLKTLTLPAEVGAIGESAFDCFYLKNVYYGGTKAQWSAISIASGNDHLTEATIHYESGVAPSSLLTDLPAPAEDPAPETEPPEEASSEVPQETALPPEEEITPQEENTMPEEENVSPEEGSAEAPQETALPPEEENIPPEEKLPTVEEAAPEPDAEPEAAGPEPSDEAEPVPQEQAAGDDAPPAAGEAAEETSPEEPAVSLLAAYDAGTDDGEVAAFRGLVPGERYVMIVAADPDAADLLSPANLLYLSQATADSAGVINYSYKTRSDSSGIARVYGAAQRRISSAEVRIEQLIDDSFRVTVLDQGTVLTEGTDYLLTLAMDDASVTATVRGRDGYSGTKTVVGEKLRAAEDVLTLDRSYIVMHPGSEPVRLTAVTNPAQYQNAVVWSAMAAEEGSTSPIDVDKNGQVRVISDQNAVGYVIASLTVSGKTCIARCRVDVVANEEGAEHPIAEEVTRTEETRNVTGVTLPVTKATVELYSTAYTRVELLLNLEQNLSLSAVKPEIIEQENTPDSEPVSGGSAVTKAVFANDKTPSVDLNALFALRPVDDRTLEIIPYDGTMLNAASVKSSYQSSLTVTVDGKDFTTPVLNLTVKKSVPKVSAKAVKLNTFVAGDSAKLVFTGAVPEELKYDEDTARAGKNPAKDAAGWLDVDYANGSVTLKEDVSGKKSGTLFLLVKPEGWALWTRVSVKVSAALTEPVVKLKQKTLIVAPIAGDTAETAYTVSLPGSNVTVSGADEGLDWSAENEVLRISANDGIEAGKTYTLKVSAVGSTKTASLKVKVSKSSGIGISLKAAGAIDTGISGSYAVLTAVPKGYNINCGESYDLSAIRNSKDKTDVTDRFMIEQGTDQPNVFRIKAPADMTVGSYTATVAVTRPGAEAISSSVKFSVKHSTKVKASLNVKAAGFIDVLDPGSQIVLTPTVKNCYAWNMDSFSLKFSSPDTFAYQAMEDGTIVITNPGSADHSRKNSVTLTLKADDGTTLEKTVSLKVKQGKSVITQSTKTLMLNRNDRYDTDTVRIAVTKPSGAAIAGVELDAKSREYFRLEDLGNGWYAIGYAEHSASGLRANSSKSVKLLVTLEGNHSGKPNATLSLKVNIK